MNYGIPYMGSKSKIVKEIIKTFPNATHFYDLFGGGFSITHAMLLHRSKSYKHFHYNEIRQGIPQLIRDSINGKYSYRNFKPEFVSREQFFKYKELDPYIKMIWSFGNNGKDYLFGKDIESYKRSMHNAIVFNKFDDTAKDFFGFDKFPDNTSILSRRLCLGTKVRLSNPDKKRLDQLQQLVQLERLQGLEQLERLEQLEFYNTSYELVPIKNESIIYCDIPYKETQKYDKNKSFNHDKFFNWAHEQTNAVYISEYNIDDDRFKVIKQIKKQSLMDNSKAKRLIKTEKLYINQFGFKKYYKK